MKYKITLRPLIVHKYESGGVYRSWFVEVNNKNQGNLHLCKFDNGNYYASKTHNGNPIYNDYIGPSLQKAKEKLLELYNCSDEKLR